MEARASIPPALPRANPTKSYWQHPPDEIADLRTTPDLPNNADIVIIGSGVSGSSIAYNILNARPNTKIVMLEARQAASGASGRNGGHTKTGTYRTFLDNVKAAGEQDAIRIAQLEYKCMVTVHAFCRQQGIQCDNRRCDTVDVFYDEGQWQKAQKSVAMMKQLMGSDPAANYTFYTPEETSSKFSAVSSLGSLTYEAGSLSAYRFTIGVLKLALSKGLNLQTNTPATSITKEPSTNKWTITTPRGPITTPTLILATNGYTPHLYPRLLGTIVPFRGIITAQRPGLSLPQTGFPHTYSYIYASGYEYMITRPQGSKHEGDIVIGGGLTKTADGSGLTEYGNTDDTALDADIVEYLTNCTETFFGKENWGKDHAEGRVRHTWSGIMGYSADGYPLVGPVPGEQGLYIDASFQGHGMVLCFLCARAVSAMVLGREEEERVGLGEWFPECFRVNERRMGLKFRGRHAPVAVERVGETEKEKGLNGVNGGQHVNGVNGTK